MNTIKHLNVLLLDIVKVYSLVYNTLKSTFLYLRSHFNLTKPILLIVYNTCFIWCLENVPPPLQKKQKNKSH